MLNLEYEDSVFVEFIHIGYRENSLQYSHMTAQSPCLDKVKL